MNYDQGRVTRKKDGLLNNINLQRWCLKRSNQSLKDDVLNWGNQKSQKLFVMTERLIISKNEK